MLEEEKEPSVKEPSVVSTLLSAPLEEVEREFRKVDLTTLTNSKKYVEMEYQRTESIKNALYVKLAEGEIDKEETTVLISEMYVILQKLEDLAKVLHALIKERKIV